MLVNNRDYLVDVTLRSNFTVGSQQLCCQQRLTFRFGIRRGGRSEADSTIGENVSYASLRVAVVAPRVWVSMRWCAEFQRQSEFSSTPAQVQE